MVSARKMEINFDITLTKKQQEAYDIIHNDDTQVLVLRFSRQSGKSVFAEVMLIEYLFKPNTFNAYISPSFAQGKKIYSEIVSMLPKEYVKKANASDLQIEMTNGAKLKFFSMESHTAIRGNTISGILCLDEAAYFPARLPNGEDPWFNTILPIIKARKPKVLVISTPCGKQGLFFDLYTKAIEGQKGYRELSASIYDDELITKEELEELKKGYPPLAWQQEFEVKFLDNAMTVFPNFETCFDRDYQQGKCWIGIDPSTVGEDDTILTVVNEHNQVRQHKVEGTLDQKYDRIASLINSYNPQHTYIEDNSIGVVMANEIRKKLINKNRFSTFTSTNETKKEYVSLIAVGISNNAIHFEKENTRLFSQFGTYTFAITKAGNVTYNAKPGYHDDTISSLGIALKCKEDFKYVGVNNNKFILMGGKRIR